MANVLSRTPPHRYLRSVNDPDYPTIDWVHNPDLSAVRDQPIKYWTVVGDVVSLLSQADRDAIDAAELAAQKEATAAQTDDGVLRAFMLVMLDEINLLRQRANMQERTIDQLRTAIRGKL